jgi:hypothetical protein
MVFLVAPPVAQEKASIPGEIAELAAKLDRAHRGGNTDRNIHSFSAQLVLETVAAGENALSIDLDADFLDFSNDERTRHYIKYRVQEEGQLIERGRSPDGYWALIDDTVILLNAARHRQDREKVQREIRLALQLLKFLDPGRVLRSLREPGGVRTESLRPGRGTPISCLVVEGFVDSFPLYYLGGQSGRVFLKLWVDESDGHLVAVQATPMTEEGARDLAHGEFILMSEHKNPSGVVLLPTELKIFKVNVQDERELQVTVHLRQFDLDPGLEPDDFRKY